MYGLCHISSNDMPVEFRVMAAASPYRMVWESRKRSTLSLENRGPVTLSTMGNTIVTSHQGRLLPKSLANLKGENVENKISQISCPQ
jgi:hypothetical protein